MCAARARTHTHFTLSSVAQDSTLGRAFVFNHIRDPVACGLPPTCKLDELAAIDIFKANRGVFAISVGVSDLNKPGPQLGPHKHYAVYHAARRLLLLYPEVVLITADDLADLSALHQRLRQAPLLLNFAIRPRSLKLCARQLWVAAGALTPIEEAHERAQEGLLARAV